jgi:hypothetical protein
MEMVNRLGKPVDKTEWGMTPPTINASYSPSYNSITFLPEFFSFRSLILKQMMLLTMVV